MLATLRQLAKAGTYARLEELGARLEAGLTDALAAQGVAGSVVREGSILWLALQAGARCRVS